MSWLLKRDVPTIQSALDLERDTRRQVQSESEDVLHDVDDTPFVHLGNGESRVLL